MEDQSMEKPYALDSLLCSFVVAYSPELGIVVSSDYKHGNIESIYALASIFHGLKNYEIIKKAAEELIKSMPKDDLNKFLESMNDLRSSSDPILCPLDNNALQQNKVK